MKKAIFLLFVLTSFMLLFYSCEKEFIADNNSKEMINNAGGVLGLIAGIGFDTTSVIESGEYYVIEGDILFYKDINKYKDDNLSKTDQFRTTQIIKNGMIIKIFLDESDNWGSLKSVISGAVDNTVQAFRVLNSGLVFTRIYSASNCNIRIDQSGRPTGCGEAGFPTNGSPYGQIDINELVVYHNSGNMTTLQLTNLISHEVGHCLGLRHTDYLNNNAERNDPSGAIKIPGTPDTDPLSLMNLYACKKDAGFSRHDRIALQKLYPPKLQYLAGNWNAGRRDKIAYRMGYQIFMDYNYDAYTDRRQDFGSTSTRFCQYFSGDWVADGKHSDNLAYRSGNVFYFDKNYDNVVDFTFAYGDGDAEDEYLVGDWDGDGKDNVAVRYKNQIYMDTDFFGGANLSFVYGRGNEEDEYLVGNWDGVGGDNIGVRREHQLLLDTDWDEDYEIMFYYGMGNVEDAYIVGDWDGDGKDNIAIVRRGEIHMDFNFDGVAERTQTFGEGFY
jgi:hypothetical protein